MGQINFNKDLFNQYNSEIRLNNDDDTEKITSGQEKYEKGDESLSIFSDAIDGKSEILINPDSLRFFDSEYENDSNISGNEIELYNSEDEAVINKNVNKIILKEIESTLNQRLNEIKADANSKGIFGKMLNGITSAFGGGTKGQENKIKELQELYQEVLNNPTKSNLSNLYKEVYGESLDYDEMRMSYQTTLDIQNGKYETADGKKLTLQDLGQAISEQVNLLSDSFDETVNSQGVISKGLSWINNYLGFGQTENMTTAQIDELKNLAEKLTTTRNPIEFAGIFKQLTGEELTDEAVLSLFSGKSMVENTKASEAMMDYEQTQEVAITTTAAVATGIATATMGPLGGAAVGAAVNVGVHGIDTVTRSNDKGVLGNLADYASNDLLKDLSVGALYGFSNVVGNKAGTFIKGFIDNASGKAAQVGIRLAGEFIEGASDGALSNAGEYMIDVLAGDSEFSTDELIARTSLGFGMGGVMSVGMQEGMRALGTGIKFLRGSTDGIDAAGKIEYSYSKLSGKNLTELQEAVNSGSIKSCKEALEAGYTLADIVSIDGQINIFKDGFIDFSNPKEVADLFNEKISQQMKVKTPEEIDFIVNDIMNATSCSEQEALQTLQRLTQFSSFKSQPDLAAALSKEQIGSLFDTGSGTSTNKALEYLTRSKHQFSLTGSQEGLILDSSALEYLKKATIEIPEDIADLTNGIVKINGHKVKLVTVDGWNIGSNGTYSGYSFLGSSLDGNEGLVKTCSDIISGKTTFNDGIQEEAAAIICKKLGIDPSSTNINITNITNDSLNHVNLSSRTIADTMAPNMSEEYIQAFFEEFPDYLGAPDAAEYRAALSEYLYDTMTFLSPESTNIAMKDMYKGIQNYLGKMNLTPDDIIYVVPEPTSSFSLVSQQFANVNGIKPSQIITYNGASSCPIDLSGKGIVILDDIVGSGNSMMSQKFKLNNFRTQYKDVPVIVAPVSSLEVGVDTITTKLSGGGVVITKHTVSAAKKYQNNGLINKIIGNTGYSDGYAATFPQYMLPDNNTAISSLFGRMSVLNPYSIKGSGGSSFYNFYNYVDKLYGYGGSIQNPTPNSLCGILIKRMKELQAKKT